MIFHQNYQELGAIRSWFMFGASKVTLVPHAVGYSGSTSGRAESPDKCLVKPGDELTKPLCSGRHFTTKPHSAEHLSAQSHLASTYFVDTINYAHMGRTKAQAEHQESRA
jgi:hypothetical protein